jgi:hypothetical protein
MFKFIFYKGDKTVGEANAETLVAAQEKLGLKDEDYDFCDDNLPIEETSVAIAVEKKPRKPRTDKGTKRNVDNKSKKVDNVTRKKPEYFLAINTILQVTPLTHDEAAKTIEGLEPQDTVRVIMGHEISFTRSVKFHF